MNTLKIWSITEWIVDIRNRNIWLCCQWYAIVDESLNCIRFIEPSQVNSKFYTETVWYQPELFNDLSHTSKVIRVLSLGEMRAILSEESKQTLINRPSPMNVNMVLVVWSVGWSEIDWLHYNAWTYDWSVLESILVSK